ncbi:MAG TPA: sensor histidine kinase [Rhizomicrobium sp.]|jgi:two-component sensor histidine kinase|nr:sensor histidine kinase [Rhizomicrobium sp.]
MAALDTLSSESISQLPGSELIREANHRIANHLSMIVGMVQIQASALAKGPESLPRATVHDILQDMAGKILSVSHLHRKLADAPHTNEIDVVAYLVESCSALVNSLSLSGRAGIAYHLGEKCLVTPEKAQTIALIVNEIVMNAVKYAHPTDLPTQITISCGRNAKGHMYLDVADDGVGLPENFDEKKDGGVGFKLIRGLTKQVGASLDVRSSSLGLLFRLTFPA